jgi:hypothetical protein
LGSESQFGGFVGFFGFVGFVEFVEFVEFVGLRKAVRGPGLKQFVGFIEFIGLFEFREASRGSYAHCPACRREPRLSEAVEGPWPMG